MQPTTTTQAQPRVTYRVFRLTNPVLEVDVRIKMWSRGMVIEENQQPDGFGYSIVISVAEHRKEAFQQTLTNAGLKWSVIAPSPAARG